VKRDLRISEHGAIEFRAPREGGKAGIHAKQKIGSRLGYIFCICGE